MALVIQTVFKSLYAEMTIAAGEINISNLPDQRLGPLSVLNERLNGDDMQTMLFGKCHQLRGPHHITVISHNLTAETTGIKTSQAG